MKRMSELRERWEKVRDGVERLEPIPPHVARLRIAGVPGALALWQQIATCDSLTDLFRDTLPTIAHEEHQINGANDSGKVTPSASYTQPENRRLSRHR